MAEADQEAEVTVQEAEAKTSVEQRETSRLSFPTTVKIDSLAGKPLKKGKKHL